MNINYPFLKDPRALLEIRKHQWIESQKFGAEIGFGSAAVDWVSKYGEQWKQAHVRKNSNQNPFLENRKYRRFTLYGSVVLMQDNQKFSAETVNISYLGLLCRVNKYLQPGSKIIIQWSFEQDGKSGLVFDAKVDKISPSTDHSGNYEMLLKFDEQALKKIDGFEYLYS